jgi:hypothetical protein
VLQQQQRIALKQERREWVVQRGVNRWQRPLPNIQKTRVTLRISIEKRPLIAALFLQYLT